jgi:hypothetical protein
MANPELCQPGEARPCVGGGRLDLGEHPVVVSDPDD